MSNSVLPFASVARLASAGDNVAIAIRTLEAGSQVVIGGAPRAMAHTVLLGHRFAVRTIAPGEELLSWGRPFGIATAPIAPGDYVCNRDILVALAGRPTGARLPDKPNFANRIRPHAFDPASFVPAPPVERVDRPATFLGFRRGGDRGVGTRNFVVILGTSSRTGGFARLLADRLQPLCREHPGIDGIVAVAHTEGGDVSEPNNMPELLRTLAGYVVHPNVGAILCVDHGVESLNNGRLREFLASNPGAVAGVPHGFLTIRGAIAEALAEGEARVRGWLPAVAAARRSEEPLAGLSIALQCGGSDAFSGISGNPLAGAVGHEVVRHGGRMCLSETDELVGAEGYILERVRDLDTAERFLRAVERFKERLAWHGSTPEGNPSGGNKLRGLYNITLKSLGAAAKKAPETRLDGVVDYAVPIVEPGFHFMDGPGNDLESIAGQVATGCNLVLFITGNGSITNFPFVPTIKITTTTARHELLRNEMDVNAGRFLDGEPMEALRDSTFALVRAVASGRRTQGERAGHSQVSIWRNWRQTDRSRLAQLRSRPAPDGRPLKVASADKPADGLAAQTRVPAFQTDRGPALARTGLVLPASLCSGQVARMAAARLNERRVGAGTVERFVALVHTEGCGFSGEALGRMLLRTFRGYLTHPCVQAALVLEHGCEKIPNDMVREHLSASGIDPDRFGWASVQLDGGIEATLARIEAWFGSVLAARAPVSRELLGLGSLSLGIVSGAASVLPGMASALADVSGMVVRAGGSVLLSLGDPVAVSDPFLRLLAAGERPRATLAHGEPLRQPGLHLVDTESGHFVENLAGLGGCGAQLFLCPVGDHPCPGHPLLPVLQIAPGASRGRLTDADIDLFLPDDPERARGEVLGLIADTAASRWHPRATTTGLMDFQLTRGHLGVTT